ncbi:Glycosyltransferase involved in cell wall bisynthesis [Planococcus glaciei]|uniref:glycosyltransferase family 4 protein n=1 Tax=Planococcus glaciei TaxID=459472 RepID=UPI0008861183|nr:glycosyltransferase family 4 protein [Planococcus glaciei]SDH86959.1 Glycosyltransferase involved in cell wall bisynthesis [Planococcus glaciei]
MKKIVIIHHSASIGGGSISLTDIVEMISEKYEVITYCPEYPPDLKEYMQKLNMKVKTFNIPIPMFNQYSGGPKFYSRSFWKHLYSYRYIKMWESLLIKENPEIVIVNSSVLALLGPTIKKIGAKSICFVRETFNENIFSLSNTFMKYMLNEWFDGVLFISNFDKNYANLKKPLTSVIADCISPGSLEKFDREVACENLGIENNSINILFAGGTSSIKGLNTLLNSIYYLNDEDLKFIICGYKQEIINPNIKMKKIFNFFIHYREREYMKKLNILLNDKKINKKIKFIGHQLNMSNAYSASDILVFPSSVAHQSRPAYEAGYFSIPVIISDFKQTKEYVQNFINGLTFTPKSHKELSEKITLVIKDEKLRFNLGEKNLYFTNNFHNFEVEKRKLLLFIKEIQK